MGEHANFWAAILAAPGDPLPRLVYADWLEEQGDPLSLAQAEYLRVECKLDALEGNTGRRRLRDRLKELRAAVGDRWWRALDRARVEGCVTFAFECTERWEGLTATDSEAVRHCGRCGHDVHYCGSVTEAREHAGQGRCVAVDTRLARLPHDLRPEQRGGRLLGRIAPRPPRRVPLPLRAAGTETTPAGE